MEGFVQFLDRYGYVLELLLSLGIFTLWMEKRKYFWLRVLALFIGFVAMTYVWGLIPIQNALTKSILTILYFVLLTLGTGWCYCLRLRQAVFCATAASVTQHLAFKMASTTLMCFWSQLETPDWILKAIYFVVFMLVVFFCYLLFARRLQTLGMEYFMNSSYVLLLLIGMQLCTNIFQNVYDQYEVGYQAYTIYNLFDITSCIFLLALQCEIAHRDVEQQDNEIMKHLLYQQKQQMKTSKETIDLINIKCHDIKNQLASLGDRVPEEELRELNRAINIYDAAFKTGNDALDLLLVEKLMRCESKDIRFDCMVEGSYLSFMKHGDVYALFGNALDNAIEAVDGVTDQEKRCISLRVKQDKGMVMLHFENFYNGPRIFLDGVPQTTKKDKHYHGFGIKSIQMITNKYHGYLSIKAKDGVFLLNIILPLPESYMEK